MTQETINKLLNDFFISDSDLRDRENFREFSNSISEIVIDDFAKNYLLNNPSLSMYTAHTDGSMILKKIKQFFAFILIAPIDEEYVKKVQNVGFVHYSIKLEPSKVSYGFWAINEIIDKISLTNPIVKENKSLISRILKFVENIMNNGFYIQQKRVSNSINKLEDINTQNELYIGFNLHKLNVKKLSVAIKNNDLEIIKNITSSPEKCSFGQIIKQLKENPKYDYILGLDASVIEKMHNQWHMEFSKIKNAFKTDSLKDIKVNYNNILSTTKELSKLLNNSLKESLEDGHLSLRSGMKAMRKMTELFYKKDDFSAKGIDAKKQIYGVVSKTILSEFSWAVEKVSVLYEEKDTKSQITKTIRYNSQNIYIAIELKESINNSYLDEILNLLLETLKLHFFVQERELSLIKFANEAENANKSKDMFLANMSHELRTPINAITGFSQILMMKNDTPDSIKKYIEKINIAGNNLLGLVNTILDFAKLESGKMQFNPSLSNISNVLSEVQVLISPLAAKKNISLSMPNIISLNLFIDNILFKQVLINLLTNAIKFTQEGGDVSLSIAYNEKQRTYRFEVKDNGIGLSEEDVQKLFQAFAQIENTYQKEQQGTGLGLMISKTIIEDLHKGHIWVESQKGEGSNFIIEMPTPMIESHTYSNKDAGKDAPDILIVEDSKEFQKLLIANLKDTHNMTITDTVNKAKELISKNSYDFLILDFFLTDGISSEILHFMEKEKISIPSIVVSAEDEIHISSSLSGSSNLQCIINKNNINKICSSLRGEVVDDKQGVKC
jgi:signal transduction histidine kinase